MSTSLAASTVTPGSTAPDVSLTVPMIALCARATVGSNTRQTSVATANPNNLRIIQPPFADTQRPKPSTDPPIGIPTFRGIKANFRLLQSQRRIDGLNKKSKIRSGGLDFARGWGPGNEVGGSSLEVE